jgi:hypothetical protein
MAKDKKEEDSLLRWLGTGAAYEAGTKLTPSAVKKRECAAMGLEYDSKTQTCKPKK